VRYRSLSMVKFRVIADPTWGEAESASWNELNLEAAVALRPPNHQFFDMLGQRLRLLQVIIDVPLFTCQRAGPKVYCMCGRCGAISLHLIGSWLTWLTAMSDFCQKRDDPCHSA
jgi:hypothetical protein